MVEKNKWAVVLGRFQPVHEEHIRIFDIIKQDGIENVLVLLGQQNSTEKDPFHYIHRANFFKNYLKSKFEEFAIAPTYDTDQGDEVWAGEVFQRVVNAVPVGADVTVYIATKKSDRDENGYHYATALEGQLTVKYVSVIAESVSATRIRNDFNKNQRLVHPDMRILMENGCVGGPPKYTKEFEEKRMRVKRSIREIPGSREVNTDFLFSSRRNRDSIAFILKFEDHFGFIIEGKPPIGDVMSMSAFGGGFDNLNDDPYRILHQELEEEAGMFERHVKKIEFKGAYLATTQSDEVVHLFLVHVNNSLFDPQTEDEGEKTNKQVWIPSFQSYVVADWKAQMIMRD